jgi:hypothetical protein
MAFTGSEKQQIRQYLGYSELFKDIDPRLESQMNDIGNAADQSAATRVRAHLTDLADVDTRLKNALDNLTLTKAEDVNFRGPEELEALRDHGRNVVQRMAIIFELEPKRDYYGSGAGMGGEIPLG